MTNNLKQLLLSGNAAIARGDYDFFVSLCDENTIWTFVGDRTLRGKEDVRVWMNESYLEPPRVAVKQLIAEDDHLVATGEIEVRNRDGAWDKSNYCDVWRFHNGKIIELNAFVVPAAGS